MTGGIRIIGDKSTLEQAVDGKPEASGGVRNVYRGGTPNGNRTRVFTVKGCRHSI